MKVIDLTNQKFGELTVIQRQGSKNGHAAWLCKCSCGNEVVVEGTELRRGNKTHCGCKTLEKRKLSHLQNDLTGQQFGAWTALSLDLTSQGNCSYWICKCQCGTVRSVAASSLTRGMSKSCGCNTIQYIQDYHKPIVIPINTQINQLTVISEPFKKYENDSHYYTTCKCECGNIIDVRTTKLFNNEIYSCGCAKSKGERTIKDWLLLNQINFKQEYKFDDLYGDNQQLRFDFAIFGEDNKLKLLVEFNGEQHYKECGGYFLDKLEKIQRYDKIKQEYCIKNNYRLVVIPYTASESEIKDILKNEMKI